MVDYRGAERLPEVSIQRLRRDCGEKPVQRECANVTVR